MSSLAQELQALAPQLRAQLDQHGFSDQQLLQLASTMHEDPDAKNRLTEDVQPPLPGDLSELPHASDPEALRLRNLGLEALSRGELAFVVLAGGMATRMGGVVKALVPAVDQFSFLDLRLAENETWSTRVGKPVPLWLMTSWVTDGPLRAALAGRLDGDRLATFVQNISLRLATDGSLFRDESGEPSLYAPGHGDLPEALKRSGLLDRFIARGGRYLWAANIDNLGATIDPTLLGWHIDQHTPVTVEVVDKVGTDKGGIPVRYRDRRLILEELRLPRSFDPTTVRVFNTNTFLFDARALQGLKMEFTWVQVRKSVGEHKAVQFERLVGEVTRELEPRFLRVSRDGLASRFLPVKDREELETRRDELSAIASARGMVP